MSPQLLAVRNDSGSIDDDGRLALAEQARLLSWFGVSWLSVAAVIAFIAGLIASSVSLVAFGIDSAIEGFSGAALLWLFGRREALPPAGRRRALRFLALQFLALSPIVAFAGLYTFLADEHAATSALGIGIATFSLVAMLGLGRAKERLGAQLDSDPLRRSGRRSTVFGFMASAVLVCLLANAIAGIWWLDPLVALAIAAAALWQGLECWHGEGWAGTSEPAEGRGPKARSAVDG